MPLYRLVKNEKLEPFKQKDFGEENYEHQLEDWLLANPTVLTGEPILYIQREEPLARQPDLVGIDVAGNLIIAELKRGATPREVVAQALDYAADWEPLGYDEIDEKARAFFEASGRPFADLAEAYQETFAPILGDEVDRHAEELPGSINRRQKLFILAQQIDERTEAISRYLRKVGLDVACFEFTYYQTSSNETVVSIEEKVGREPLESTGGRSRTSRPKHPVEFGKFLVGVREGLRQALPENLRDFEATRRPQVALAVHYDPPGWTVRYQPHFGGYGSSSVYTPLFLNIHLEHPEEAINDHIFEQLRNRMPDWKPLLGDSIELMSPGASSKTRLICEPVEWSGKVEDLTEEFQRRIVDRMVQIIQTIKPLVDDILRIRP